MVQAFGGLAWLSLLASASALCYPAVRGHLSCVARVNPAMARVPWKPMAVVDVDRGAPQAWYLRLAPGVVAPGEKALCRALTGEQRARIEVNRIAALERRRRRLFDARGEVEA